jgi:limonene-1,2-epoxide hydrolase
MPVVEKFKEVFNALDAKNLHLVEELYAPDVHFADPFHEIKGRDALREYFARLYDGVESCRFAFADEAVNGKSASLTWVMCMRHRRFREEIIVPGCSFIRFDDKVTYHRDYFDAGRLIYENVPLLGGVIRTIKARL